MFQLIVYTLIICFTVTQEKLELHIARTILVLRKWHATHPRWSLTGSGAFESFPIFCGFRQWWLRPPQKNLKLICQ